MPEARSCGLKDSAPSLPLAITAAGATAPFCGTAAARDHDRRVVRPDHEAATPTTLADERCATATLAADDDR
jgi:hypothetical protein